VRQQRQPSIRVRYPMHTVSYESDICLGLHLQWNQTGVRVAGIGSSGSSANQFKDASCVYVTANYSIFVCDHHNDRIQMWPKGAATGITVSSISGDHPEYLTFDKNGLMYSTGHNVQRVLRFTSNFASSTIVAGQLNSGSNAANELDDPWGMQLDDNLNLYIAERTNERVVKWPLGATTGTIVIANNANTPKFYGLQLAPNSTDRVYLSSVEANEVYLWVFNAASPLVTLSQVTGSPSSLSKPYGIKLDPYGNLYVADENNNRIVKYCVNHTIGTVPVGGSGSTPSLSKPIDVAFDVDLNMYVLDQGQSAVYKYGLL
jgi:hypothetical protein